MAEVQTFVSPDGALRFYVSTEEAGDVTLGFEGFPWHTHADLLVGFYGENEKAAVAGFLDALLQGALVVRLEYVGGSLRDVAITVDPAKDLQHAQSDEHFVFRRWDGSPFHSNELTT
jgi:hypothetical protein